MLRGEPWQVPASLVVELLPTSFHFLFSGLNVVLLYFNRTVFKYGGLLGCALQGNIFVHHLYANALTRHALLFIPFFFGLVPLDTVAAEELAQKLSSEIDSCALVCTVGCFEAFLVSATRHGRS